MGLGLMLVGIAVGLIAAVAAMVLGGGIGVAALAYVGGGFVGMSAGLAGFLSPGSQVAALASQDQG
jgi:hypothetical protein